MGSEREQWRKLDEQAIPGPWAWNGYSAVYSTPRCEQYNAEESLIPDEAPDDDPRWEQLPEITAATVENISWAAKRPRGDLATIDGEANARFIAAARTGWPAAEAEVEQLRALLREAREYIADEWSENCTIIHQIDALLGEPSDG